MGCRHVQPALGGGPWLRQGTLFEAMVWDASPLGGRQAGGSRWHGCSTPWEINTI